MTTAKPKRFARTKPLDAAKCVMGPLATELRVQSERVLDWQAKLDRARTDGRRRVVGAELRAAKTAKQRAEVAFFDGTIGFRWKMVRKYQGDDVDTDDLDSVSKVALWKAALSWRSDGGCPFDTWARQAMRWELWRCVSSSRVVKDSGRGDCVSLSDRAEMRALRLAVEMDEKS